MHPVRSKVGIAALVLSGALGATTGLAAAGTLPTGAQALAHDVLAKVGISVPDANASGLPDTTKGSQISDIARTTSTTGVDKGAQVSTAASGGKSHAGQNGSTASGSPVPTPNGGGTGTANTASGGASDSGTTTADAKSQGHSAAGSGNAASGR